MIKAKPFSLMRGKPVTIFNARAKHVAPKHILVNENDQFFS